jgi:hypothetical protein
MAIALSSLGDPHHATPAADGAETWSQPRCCSPMAYPGLRRSATRRSPYRGKVDFGILPIREDENAAVLRRFAKVATDEQQRR